MDFEQIYKISAPYTVTSKAKMRSLYEAVKYINQNHVKGSFVECGVYRGGSVMNMALTQQTFSNVVHIYLFDTYEGMTPPGEFDVNHQDVEGAKIISIGNKRSVASLEEVKNNVAKTGYAKEFLHFIKGDVADTLPNNLPPSISLLRLDVDWYEPTKISLELLYPRLVKNGVLIMDDYGYWKGARKAADDYFASRGEHPVFEPMESGISGVIYIKKN
jgi:hypothetical protein